ncbi:MAG: protein kinase [Vulcanimicrobiota bacterium]
MSSLGVTVAGRYRLDALLGKGNLGNVYLAQDLQSQRRVTLKLAHSVDQANSRSLSVRFRRELELGAKLRHPAIVKPLDAGEFLGSPFLVCEHVDGQSLLDWFESQGRNYELLAGVLETVLEALSLAHSHKVPHRALKPDHILVDQSGQPMVLDFGLSARLDDQIGRSPMALAYLSPEQILGARGDGRSDLYALGAILYHLAAGGPPFLAPTNAQMLLSHLHQQPVPLSNLPRSVPTWLDRLVRRLLSKHADDRPTSAQDVLSLVRRRPSRGPHMPAVLAPLLGREAEIAFLTGCLDNLSLGEGNCIWIWGETGVGKSHLLHHLRRQALREVEWVELDPGEVRPLHWVDWVKHPLLGFYPDANRLQEWSSEKARICVIHGFEQADDSLWGLLADWADTARRTPLLLILVSQTAPRETFRPRLTGDLQVAGLSREQCARLIEERLWSPPPPEAATWLHRVSGGNPLFLGLLLEKTEGTYLAVDGPSARWQAPPTQLEVDLQTWLTRELGELGESAADFLAVAAIIGARFPYNLIKSLYLGEEAQLEQLLDQLMRLGWLQESWEAGVASHRFTHRARWQASLAQVDRRRARRLAGLVGAFLEFPQSGSPDWERAADYYELAADQRSLLRTLTQCLLLACESEEWELARAWMKRCQRAAASTVERIFPGPWYHFGWVGSHAASGPRHFLATLLASQGRSEEALWYLQLSLEDNLEDDPPRWVENLLLRVVFQLRGWVQLGRPLVDLLQEARQVAHASGFEQGEALASALALRLSPAKAAPAGTPTGWSELEGR